MLTCLHAYMLTCLHAYMLTYLHVYVLACLRTYTFERWHDSCLHAFMLTCLHAYMYSHGYMLVCLNVGMIHAYRQRAQLICKGIFDFRLPPSSTAQTQGQYDLT